MTILSVETGISDGEMLIACIVIVAVACLLSIVMVAVCSGGLHDIADWFIVAVSTFLLGGLLCIGPISAHCDPTKYKVIFDSGIPESFYDDYEIIKQEGRIFTIQSIRKEE